MLFVVLLPFVLLFLFRCVLLFLLYYYFVWSSCVFVLSVIRFIFLCGLRVLLFLCVFFVGGGCFAFLCFV